MKKSLFPKLSFLNKLHNFYPMLLIVALFGINDFLVNTIVSFAGKVVFNWALTCKWIEIPPWFISIAK